MHQLLRPVDDELKKLQDSVEAIRELALSQMDQAERLQDRAEILQEKVLNLEENVQAKQKRIDELTATLKMLAEADDNSP